MIITKRLAVEKVSLDRSHGQLLASIHATHDFFHVNTLVLNLARPPLVCAAEDFFRKDTLLELKISDDYNFPAECAVRMHNLHKTHRPASNTAPESFSYSVRFARCSKDPKHGTIYPPLIELMFDLTAQEYADLCGSDTYKKGRALEVSLSLVSEAAVRQVA